jgi:hypothetical protein
MPTFQASIYFISVGIFLKVNSFSIIKKAPDG